MYPLVEFWNLAFTRMPGESYWRRCRPLLCSCDVFLAIIISLLRWFYTSVLGLIVFQITLLFSMNCSNSVWSSPVNSGQYDIYAIGKAHMRSTPSLRSFPIVVFQTVPMFVWLTMALSHPFKEDRLALPLPTHVSSRRSIVWCPWLCARS